MGNENIQDVHVEPLQQSQERRSGLVDVGVRIDGIERTELQKLLAGKRTTHWRCVRSGKSCGRRFKRRLRTAANDRKYHHP
jgi:hypothetical protein